MPANAAPIAMSLPPRTYIVSGVRVLGGWVVNAQFAGNFHTDGWFQPDDGAAPTRLANNIWAVSRDGRTLVVAGRTEPTLTAYRLPSMEKLADTRIPRDDTAQIGAVQIVGDGAFATYTLRGATPDRAARWDLTTYAATNLATTMGSWGTAGDSVLRLVDNGNESCVDLVPVAHFTDAGTSGVCSTYLDRAGGELSPDGRQAVIVGGDAEPDLLVATADLHAGVWRPTTITGAKHFIGWDSATSFLAQGDGSPGPMLRCTGPDTCSPIGLPAGEPRIAFLRDDLS